MYSRDYEDSRISTSFISGRTFDRGDPPCTRTHGNDLALTQSVDPILVPQQIQQLGVQARFEDGHLELIVRVGVDAEIFDLVERDGLVVAGGSIGRGVTLSRQE